MRGYGLPRHLDLESPDKVDITFYGLAPHRHGEKRRSSVKKASRRYWKHRERKASKLALTRALHEKEILDVGDED